LKGGFYCGPRNTHTGVHTHACTHTRALQRDWNSNDSETVLIHTSTRFPPFFVVDLLRFATPAVWKGIPLVITQRQPDETLFDDETTRSNTNNEE
jgi:hypothetical protein